jgi:hypothetical protein
MRLELIKDLKRPTTEVTEGSSGSGMDQVVSTEGAAKILGVNASRVRQFVADGRLTPVEKTDSDHYFKRADVEALAKKPRERTGRPEGSKNKKDD